MKMKGFNMIVVAVSLSLVAFFNLPVAIGAPYMLSDDRVRSLEITPVLGRGYSVMTNNFLSTCLEGAETTVPSYNYDYSFSDFTREKSIEDVLDGELFNSFGYSIIKSIILPDNSTSTDKYVQQKYYVVSSMRVERFYASIKEEVSTLTESAEELLSLQDYLGFFTTCGSNYVRSIRRAQEVVAIFSFSTTNPRNARDFAEGLKISGFGDTVDNKINHKARFKSIIDSLEIKVLGFGLGLNQQGAGNLIATTIEEYNKVTDFAFRAMTQSEGGSHNLGMVYGVEVMPWVDNTGFQVASRLLSETIEVPLPRSIIPKAYHSTNSSITEFDIANVADYSCKESEYVIDKYGYCCEQGALYNAVTKEYNSANQTISICRPLRNLDKNVVKNNMSTNGEFVCRLDATVRSKMNQFSALERCVSSVRSIPNDLEYSYLRPQSTSRFDPTLTTSFTVKELKIALDPFNDYGLVKHVGKELDEFMDMFYQPCVKALFGGRDGDSDAMNFVILPWHVHDECLMLSCLSDNVRWNRAEEGGCVSSLISGVDAAGYSDSDRGCSYDSELAADEQICKYPSSNMTDSHTRFTQCWNNTLPQGNINYFIDQFCLPNMGGELANEDFQTQLDASYSNHCS